ncbi:ALF repeat-containing protein, partial [Streptomyces sp. NPDC059567]|uniref:ALF repeat-containing protein n=1 Tax=Streptomyces sp. NPDC059567 TaxID=3346867 RepID=UPI003683ECAC
HGRQPPESHTQHPWATQPYEWLDQPVQERKARLTNTASPAVKEAAKKALLGTPADRTAFLEKGRHLAQAEDDLVELARIDEGSAGPILSEAIHELLIGSPTPAELRHFLEVTQHDLRDQDNRVAIAQIISEGGPELVKAGRTALAGTPADRAAFLLTGQHQAGRRTTRPSRRTTRATTSRARTDPETAPGTTPARTPAAPPTPATPAERP